MRRVMKRCGAGLVALALVATSSLGMVVNVAAESSIDYCDEDGENYDYYMCRLENYSALSDGSELIAERFNFFEEIDFDNEGEVLRFLFGDENYKFVQEIQSAESEMDTSSDEYRELVVSYVDQMTYYPILNDEYLLGLHIEKNGEKVPYSGDKITVRYRYGFDPFEDDEYKEFLGYSTKEWKPAVLHVMNDWSRELLPASIDDDGVWEFETSSFSLFVPVFMRVIEEEAPKTSADGGVLAVMASIGIISAIAVCFGVRAASKR